MSKATDYHHQTKHLPTRSAKSPGYMDWENQPNPFRTYEGAKTIDLPFRKKSSPVTFDQLFRRAPDRNEPLTLDNVAYLLEYSLGLSAWKSYGNEAWSLRMNPSSGNLHPTEAHLVLPAMKGLDAGVYHYDPFNHRLELRRVLSADLSDKLFPPLRGEGFLLILSSIYWRESWKYGERAFRYCQHDTGHAMAGISFAAALNGWRSTVVHGAGDDEMRKLAGFDKTDWPTLEEEQPTVMLHIHGSEKGGESQLPASVIDEINGLDVVGQANALSPEHVDWEIIRDVEESTRKPSTVGVAGTVIDLPEKPYLFPELASLDAEHTIRARRSAQAFNPSGLMKTDSFFDLLDRTLPRAGAAPFDLALSTPVIHLVLFVHHVQDMDPGIYFLLRNDADFDDLKQRMLPSYSWEQVHDQIPLYLLEHGNFKDIARDMSCRQDIAGDSCFSLGMVGRFESLVSADPHLYRQLFWEAGMIGQVLYLAAEAHGFRGTGIGCYFDDPVHELLGFGDSEFQSFYHFTVGEPLEDERISTHPAYVHLQDGRKS